MTKLVILIVSILVLGLGVFAVSVCGIVFGALDMAHGIYNAKSICFLVFGILGVIGSPFSAITLDI